MINMLPRNRIGCGVLSETLADYQKHAGHKIADLTRSPSFNPSCFTT